MRYRLLILSACALIIASCSKSSHNAPPDNGCIERIDIRLSDPILTAAAIQTADSLFDANHINHSHYLYLGMRQDIYNGRLEQFITVDQYANGLRLFTSSIKYLFWDGILHFTSGTPTQGTMLDTVPSLPLSRLRTLFTNDIRRNTPPLSPGLTDSCYKAEFGYINIATGNAPENLIKAWRVSIKYTGKGPAFGYPYDYPYAYYKDSNGQLISFITGIFPID